MEFEGEIIYKWWEFSCHVWLPEGNQGFHDRTSSFGFGFQPTLMYVGAGGFALVAHHTALADLGAHGYHLCTENQSSGFVLWTSSARKNTHPNYQKALTRSNKHEIALKFLKWVEFCPWWFDKSPSPRRINCQELYVKFIKDGEVLKEIAWWGLPKVWGAV